MYLTLKFSKIAYHSCNQWKTNLVVLIITIGLVIIIKIFKF